MTLFLFFSIFCISWQGDICIDDSHGHQCSSLFPSSYNRKLKIINSDQMSFPEILEISGSYVNVTILAKESKMIFDITNNSKKIIFSGVSDTDTIKVKVKSLPHNEVEIQFRNVLVEIVGSTDFFSNSLIMENSSFLTPNAAIETRSIKCLDSKSLKNIASITTEHIELIFDNQSTSEIQQGTIINVIKSKSVFSQDNPQIVLNNYVNCDVAFGANSLSFFFPSRSIGNFSLKIFSNIFPYIQIDHYQKEINFMCFSNLSPNSLLTPNIEVFNGKCNFYSSSWPKEPRPIQYHWNKDNQFIEKYERKIWVILSSLSVFSVFGKNIPISIKSQDVLTININTVDCGITGSIVINTPFDSIVRSTKSETKFYFNDLVNITSESRLLIDDSLITIFVGVCTNLEPFKGSSQVLCCSVDDSDGFIKNSTHVNLIEDGNITYALKDNFERVTNKVLAALDPPPIGNIYTESGNYDFDLIFSYLKNIFSSISTGKIIDIALILQSIGNTVDHIPQLSTKGTHTINLKRKDFMYSLFYQNYRKWPRVACVYDDGQFDKNKWKLNVENFAQSQNFPFLTFENTRIPMIISNDKLNNGYCVTLYSGRSPNSAIEVLVYFNDDRYSDYLKYASGILVNFIATNKLSQIHKCLYNSNAKNIIIVILSELSEPLNIENVQSSSNVFIVGLNTDLFSELISGNFSTLDLSKYMMKMTIKHKKLESLAVVFGNIENDEINARRFASLMCDFKNQNIKINSDELIVDLDVMKKINQSLNSFQNLILIPLNLHPISYEKTKSVKFSETKWEVEFSNTIIEVDYSLVKKDFYIMTGIKDNLTLIANKKNSSNIKFIGIGYDVGLDRNLSSFPAIPLLEDNSILHNLPLFSENNVFGFGTRNIIKTLASKLLDVSDAESEYRTLDFEGDWGKISQFDNDLLIRSDSSYLSIHNFPSILINYSDIISYENIIFNEFDEQITISRPINIRNKKTIFVPKNTVLYFSEINIVSRNSVLTVKSKDEMINQKFFIQNLKVMSNSSVSISNISLSQDIIAGKGSVVEMNDLEISDETNVILYFDLYNQYPLIKLSNINKKPKKINVIYSDQFHTISDSELAYFCSHPKEIVMLKSESNLCDSWKDIFELSNDGSSLESSRFSSKLHLYCEFSNGITTFGLNITDNVIEGEINTDYDLGKVKNSTPVVTIAISVVCSLVVCAIIAGVVFFFVKRRRTRSELDDNVELSSAQQARDPLNDSD